MSKPRAKQAASKGVAIKLANKMKSKGKFPKKKPQVKTFGRKETKVYDGQKGRTKRQPGRGVTGHRPDDNVQRGTKRPVAQSSEEESSDDEDENDVQYFEKRPRLQFQTLGHVEPEIEELAHTTDDVVPEHPVEIESKAISLPTNYPKLSLMELIAAKKRLVREQKQMIGNVCVSVVSHPEKNLKHLKPLIALMDLRKDDPVFKLAFPKQQSLIAYSLLEVFKDILPSYRIKESPDEDVVNKKLKIETRELREYESCLLKYYGSYISKLQRMTECVKKRKQSNFYDQALPNFAAKEKISLVGTRCLCSLMLSHSNFNLNQTIIDTVAPLMSSRLKSIRELAFEHVTRLFREDRTGQVSLMAVKSAGKIIRAYKMNVDPLVIQSFLHLRIREVRRKDETIDMKAVREEQRKQSKKERKHNKEMLELKRELKETDAREDQEKKIATHTQILNHIFFVFFRFIRDFIQLADEDFAKNAAVMSPVLEGLSKFAHLINIDFFDDLISLLYRLIVCQRLSDKQSLYCLNTVFTILSGEGTSINVDPQRFYARFYTALLNFDVENDDESFVNILMECFDKLLFRRKKQLTMARVLAFCKRSSSIALHTSPETSAVYLTFVRILLQDHPKADLLMDSEYFGSGSFDPLLPDPEFCNANATRLWEIHLLRKHFDAFVGRTADLQLQRMRNNKVKSDFFLKSANQVFADICAKNRLEKVFGVSNVTRVGSIDRKKGSRAQVRELDEREVRSWHTMT